MNGIDDKALEEELYKEAFNQAINAMESTTSGTPTPQPGIEDSSVKENDDNGVVSFSNNPEWDDKDTAQRQAAIDEGNAQHQEAPRKRGRPRKDEAQVDTENEYEKLYKEYRQTAESQIGLYKSRLNQLSHEFQELKAKTEQKKEEPVQLPEDAREVFEMYPDIAKAVSAFVESKLSHTKQSMIKDVEEQIKPIKSHLVLTDVQKHENAIKAAHPDLGDILQSGDLNRWIEELPPVMKAGAQHVYQYGDTNAVISLLNDYKESRGISRAESNSGKQPGREVRRTHARPQDSGNSEFHRVDSRNYAGGTGYGYGERGTGGSVMEDDDPLVQRVLNALAVKSGSTPVNLNTNPVRREKTAEDIFKEVTADFESTRRRHR